MILDADVAVQPGIMMPVTTEGSLEGLAATIESADGVERFTATPASDFEPCYDRYGGGTPVPLASCVIFEFAPRHGVEYSLTVSADGRPTATGSARVPGDFRVLAADAEGTAPPGSDGLTASWTSSAVAYTYIVALRATCPPWYAEFNDCACHDPDAPSCTNVVPDRQGWFGVSRDTAIATVVDGVGADEMAAGRAPWFLDVYAMSRGLVDFLTTGNAGGLFPVAPVQNIDGGAGVFGALVRRTIELDDPAAAEYRPWSPLKAAR